MHDRVKNQALNSGQLNILSVQTCQWWNAVFIQARRFLDDLKNDHGGTPWENDETNSVFVADRLFLIVAVYHAIESLEKLSIELQRNNDTALTDVLSAIYAVVPSKNIADLRNMNIHGLDYLSGQGFGQNHYQSEVNDGQYKIITTAAWTYSNGETKSLYIGNVPIDKLLVAMKAQFPKVKEKTEEVFNRTLFG